MLTKDQYSEIKKLLTPTAKVTITTHKSPDGDAIGSSLGLYHLLKKLGVTANVIVPNDYPEFLNWMEGNDSIVNFEKHNEVAEDLIKSTDLLFCLDYNTIGRTGKIEDSLKAYKGISVMIDHHPQPDSYATYLYSDINASSTAQLVYEFACGLNAENLIDETLGACLYAGIMTDTGSFRFAATSARTHYIVGELMNKGLKPHLIHQAIYDSNTENRLKLLGYCLSEKMKLIPKFNTAYIILTNEELLRFNYQSGDTEGVVNYALSIKGIRFAAIIKENEENIRMSFRSKGEFSANQFARDNFSGGGHLNAAGGMSTESLDATIAKFEAALPNYKELSNA